ncbi:Glutathione S-transferase 1 [Penicillium rolfsii]|nr:Glutathione S-transferase 1 [Penicillium rolfsii]
MAHTLKPIKIYGGSFGPNPLKVSIILQELGLPVEEVPTQLYDLKKPEYQALNPNGRLPTIEDPNTGIVLWESGAIIEYLIETYDKDHALSFPRGSPEAHHARQFLHFQMSGQGPYFGQAVWFKRYHPERVQSAIDRYITEVRRVSGVLDRILAKREWLVGGRVSYADLAFVSWQNTARNVLAEDGYDENDFPNLSAWLARLNSRPVVKELNEKQQAMMAEKLERSSCSLDKIASL